MNTPVDTSRFSENIGQIARIYPSFDITKTTNAQCHFHDKKWIKCADDLGRIIRDGWWMIAYVLYTSNNISEKTDKLDLILHDKDRNVLDVTIYFKDSQYIDNLKLLFKLNTINIGNIGWSYIHTWGDFDFGFVPDIPEITSFITLAGCMGSVVTLLQWHLIDDVNSIVM